MKKDIREKTEREKLDDALLKIKSLNLRINRWFSPLQRTVQIIIWISVPLVFSFVCWPFGNLAVLVIMACSRAYYLWKQRKYGFYGMSYGPSGILKGTCDRCGERDVDVTQHVCEPTRGRYRR